MRSTEGVGKSLVLHGMTNVKITHAAHQLSFRYQYTSPNTRLRFHTTDRWFCDWAAGCWSATTGANATAGSRRHERGCILACVSSLVTGLISPTHLVQSQVIKTVCSSPGLSVCTPVPWEGPFPVPCLATSMSLSPPIALHIRCL